MFRTDPWSTLRLIVTQKGCSLACFQTSRRQAHWSVCCRKALTMSLQRQRDYWWLFQNQCWYSCQSRRSYWLQRCQCLQCRFRISALQRSLLIAFPVQGRSEERRVGKEC